MEKKEFNYEGKKISYRTTGSGPMVVLLHGFGEEGSVWRNQYNLFLDNQLVIPDLPGSGESDMIDDMSMEGLAVAMMEMINTIGREDERIILIGHSMGGYVTLAFAEKYPERLKAFGLFHSTAFADSEEKKETRRKGISFVEQHGAFSFLKTSVSNLFAPANREQNEALIEEQFDTVRNFSGTALVHYYEAMMQRPDRTAVLQKTTQPVLFVMGKYDAAVPLEDGLKLCYLPQLSYIHLLENSGHMGMLEEAAHTNQLFVQFVKDVNTA